ncbi:uncharacterized protein [Dysidea avara]|uniref:uncharacterized protein isoform X2 n=1 Tax=Dysidea avara TaxID=196820 RepID=UPI003319A15D
MVLLSMVTSWFLLLSTVLCGGCYGESSGNCTAPTFEDAHYVHDYNCYRYYLSAIFVEDQVVMQVKVAQNNLSFKWWRGHHESIDCKLGQTCQYHLTNDNMTLTWSSAEKGKTLFYVNATNNCGSSSIACFVVEPFCQLCPECPVVSKPTHIHKSIREYSNLTLNSSVKVENIGVALQWCFVTANKQKSCCVCDNHAGVDPGTCLQSDWNLTAYYGDICSYTYGCLLSVSNVSMKYSGGVFVSNILFALQNESFLYTHIRVTQNNTASHDQQLNVLYYTVGGGACVGLFVVIALSTIVCVRRYQKIHLQENYEELPPYSSPGKIHHHLKPQPVNEDHTTHAQEDRSGTTAM